MMWALRLVVAALLLATPALAATHADLVALYTQFRADIGFTANANVPDHTPAAMARREAAARTALVRLEAMDDSGWPVAERVDWMIALGEMRAVLFQHRHLRQWQRDPSWWATLDIGWGPKVDTAWAPPKLPLKDAAARADLAQKLASVPAVLTAARASLTDMKGDLITLALAHHRIEARLYARMAADLGKSDPALAKAARTAEAASKSFADWLEQTHSKVPAGAGIGQAAMDWYLVHVLYFPWNSAEMAVLGEREWERSVAFLKMEEHEHRGQPMLPAVTTLADFERIRREADEDILAYLKAKDLMTVPDWLVVPPPEGPYVMPQNQDPAVGGPFDPPIRRNFFRQAEDRDPRSLRAHNLPGHIFDFLWRSRDPRPIRGQARVNFLDSQRFEGWAFYLEEMMLQAGWLDARPKAREIHYILQANRAARLAPELKVHSGEWSLDEALTSLAGRTPYWMAKTDDTAVYDMALYLRQPGLGLNYYFGKLQLEQLLAEVGHKEGQAFNLGRFHDRFIASGIIPIALTRWEMLGDEGQVKRFRDAPPMP
ncbi:DUF885 family protein [Sandarakinorhabdus sp.]|uniref:DUF885 family protein n=1 Tax=Sandarakinorhabdus sp. TaxID=1916663 RepID=UPI003F720939